MEEEIFRDGKESGWWRGEESGWGEGSSLLKTLVKMEPLGYRASGRAGTAFSTWILTTHTNLQSEAAHQLTRHHLSLINHVLGE